jgi:hypothetical protein
VSSSSLSIEQILTMLGGAPPRIAALTAELAPAQLHTPPDEDEWSANDVLAHLRACADVWGNCIREIIAKDRPTIRAVSPRTWIRRTDYLDQEFQPSFRAYTAQRTDLLATLESLAPEAWSRSAKVTGAGKPLERTLLTYAEDIAIHERPHLKQIARIVSMMRV